MADNWNNLWMDEDKIRRWSIPDHHFVSYIDTLGDIEGLKVLDIGAGLGRHSVFLAKKGCFVTSIDPSESCLNHLSSITKNDNLNIDIINGDLKYLANFNNAQFDIIICFNVLYHERFGAMVDALKEIDRILTANGKFYLTMNSTNNIHYGAGIEVEPNTFKDQKKIDGEHLHHYSDKEEVINLLKSFSIIRLEEDEEEVGGKRFKDRWHWYIAAKKANA